MSLHIIYIRIIHTDAAEILEPSIETEDVEEGENVTLTCVGVGHPPPLVQWRKLNGSLSDRATITNMSMSTNEGNVTRVTVDLIFTEAYREDTGVYECLVHNLLNSVEGDVLLTVQCMYACVIRMWLNVLIVYIYRVATYRILGIVHKRKLSQHVDCCSIRKKMFANIVFLFKIFHNNIK